MQRLALTLMGSALTLVPVCAEARSQDESPTQPAEDIVLYHPTIETMIVVNGGMLPQSPGDGLMTDRLITPRRGNVGQRIENVLRDEAGLVQFRRSDGRSAHPTSQGVALRGLGGNAASRAIVLLDGVPQADPFGGWVPWSSYDSLNVGGIRVVRGGGSGLDGPGALGGTISLYSRGDDGFDAAAALGSRASFDGSARAGISLAAGELAIDGRWSGGDGFVPIARGQRGLADRAAPYRQGGGGLRAIIRPGNGTSRVEATVRGSYDRRDRGVDFTTSRITGVDASIRFVHDPTPYDGWRASALAYVQLRDLETGFAAIAAGRTAAAPTLAQRVPATGIGARIELRPPLGEGNPVTFGADWRRSSGQTIEDSNFSALQPTRNRRAGGHSDIIGLFAAYDGSTRYTRPVDLSWSLSARIDRWTLANGYRVERDIGGAIRADARFANRSGWQPTARVAMGWRIDDFMMRAAAYRGWRLPTLNELYRPFRAGADATAANEMLKPERFHGVEAGFDWTISGDATLAFTAYSGRLSDGIANVTLGQGPGTFPGVGFVATGGRFSQRQNIDSIHSNGLEASLDINMTPLRFSARYALTDARVQAGGSAIALDGKRPAQIARHLASATLRFRDADDNSRLPVSGEMTVRYVGAQNDDDLGLLRLDDAVTADASINVRLREGLYFDARGENLFDALLPAAITSGGIVERAMPRTFWVGLRLDFQ